MKRPVRLLLLLTVCILCGLLILLYRDGRRARVAGVAPHGERTDEIVGVESTRESEMTSTATKETRRPPAEAEREGSHSIDVQVVLVPAEPGISLGGVSIELRSGTNEELSLGNWAAVSELPVAASGVTDPTGTVVLRAPEAGVYLVNLLDPYLVLLEDGWIEVASGGTHRSTLRVRAGGALEGMVRGGDGLPVKDANVGLLVNRRFGMEPGLAPPFLSAANVRITRTDGAGRYRLGGLLPGSALVEAHKEGLAAGAFPCVDVFAGGTVVAPDIVLSESARLELEVLDAAGRPVLDYSLCIDPADESFFCTDRLVRVQSSAGRYTVPLPEGEYAIAADGGAAGYSQSRSIRVPATGFVSATLTLANAGIAVLGHARSTEDLPVPGAEIELWSGTIQRRAVAGEEGRFEFLGVPSGTCRVNAKAEGFAAYSKGAYLRAGEELQVLLAKECLIAGTFSDGAQGFRGYELIVFRADGAVERRAWVEGQEFHEIGLAPGNYTLMAVHEATTGLLPDVRLAAGEAVTTLRIEPVRGAQWTGRVTDALTGLSLGGVEVLGSMEDDGITYSSTMTLGDGGFIVPVFKNAVVQLRKPGYRPSKLHVTEAEPREVGISLQPLCRLAVRLTDELHEPISGAQVQVASAEAFSDAPPDEVATFTALVAGGVQGRRLAVSDEEGRAHFEGLEPGDYWIEARSAASRVTHRTYLSAGYPAEVELRIPLDAGLKLTGRVLRRGAALCGAHISLYQGLDGSEGHVALSTTDAAGTFALRGLAPGPHLARVSWNGETFLHRFEVSAGGHEEIDFPSSALLVDVLDPSGRPAPADLPVLVIAEDGARCRRFTNEEGVATFNALSPGRFEVIAPDPSCNSTPFAPSVSKAALAADAEGRVTLSLAEGHRLACRLESGPHHPPFTVRLVEAGKKGGRNIVLHEGTLLSFGGLTPGLYDLTATAGDGGHVHRQVSVPQAGEVLLRFEEDR